VAQHALADERVVEVEHVDLRAADVRAPHPREHGALLGLGHLELLDGHLTGPRERRDTA
jgi:hypothetical protein